MKTLFGVVVLATFMLVAGVPALATTAEICGDAAMLSADIDVLLTGFNAGTGYITVVLGLCAPPDNQTKYRVHFDHTAPFATDADRDSDGFITPEDFCFTTSDDTMIRHGNKKATGPGVISMGGNVVRYMVHMTDLSPDLEFGSTILIWADTQNKGSQDRDPDTYGDNGCSKPEMAGEFIELTLTAPCTVNAGCPPDEFCRKVEGDCDGTGVCSPMPEGCPGDFDPVCGCDSVTYSNACLSAVFGQNVAFSGECP